MTVESAARFELTTFDINELKERHKDSPELLKLLDDLSKYENQVFHGVIGEVMGTVISALQEYDTRHVYRDGFDHGLQCSEIDGSEQYESGKSAGRIDGYDEGYQHGYSHGKETGFQEGLAEGRGE